uniref:Uncharacterized protein n=1 Tax=Anguilla anguilla TaxID=7936 RepID=A0A0E9UTT1_ANGAN
MDAAGSKSTCFHVKYETENLKQNKTSKQTKTKTFRLRVATARL